MTYRAAGERLGLQASAVAARARRGRWPKRLRNDTGEAEVLVPADALAPAPNQPSGTRPVLPAPVPTPDATADAVRAAVAPLQALLERETQDRRTLQGQADALRDQLAAAQLDAAKAHGDARTEAAMREAAEARAKDLQRQLDALQAKPRRRWWPF
jgi:type IV secretory pathway VirB10-like protein